MSKQHDGGPAFPVWELNGQGKPEMTGFGMTLRDFFAAKAMQGLMAMEMASEFVDDDGNPMSYEPGSSGTLFIHTKHLAIDAYNIADRMLAARNAKEGA